MNRAQPAPTPAQFDDVRQEVLELTDLLHLLGSISLREQAGYIEGALAVCARAAQAIGEQLEAFAPPS